MRYALYPMTKKSTDWPMISKLSKYEKFIQIHGAFKFKNNLVTETIGQSSYTDFEISINRTFEESDNATKVFYS